MNIMTSIHVHGRSRVKKCLVLVDADNINYRQVPEIIEKIGRSAGPMEVRCYGDWNSEILKPWKKSLAGLEITYVQQALIGGKNSTDAGIFIDGSAAITLKKYESLAIVSRDRDFVPLINKAKSEGMFVIGAGQEPVSRALINACDEFIIPSKVSHNEKAQWAMDAICTAIQKYGKDGFANLSDIGNYLRYLDPHFTALSLGKKKLADFISDYPDVLRMRSCVNNPNTRTTTVYVGRA